MAMNRTLLTIVELLIAVIAVGIILYKVSQALGG
jgi:hypothetical protein